jgi:hypothetical protein
MPKSTTSLVKSSSYFSDFFYELLEEDFFDDDLDDFDFFDDFLDFLDFDDDLDEDLDFFLLLCFLSFFSSTIFTISICPDFFEDEEDELLLLFLCSVSMLIMGPSCVGKQ